MLTKFFRNISEQLTLEVRETKNIMKDINRRLLLALMLMVAMIVIVSIR